MYHRSITGIPLVYVLVHVYVLQKHNYTQILLHVLHVFIITEISFSVHTVLTSYVLVGAVASSDSVVLPGVVLLCVVLLVVVVLVSTASVLLVGALQAVILVLDSSGFVVAVLAELAALVLGFRKFCVCASSSARCLACCSFMALDRMGPPPILLGGPDCRLFRLGPPIDGGGPEVFGRLVGPGWRWLNRPCDGPLLGGPLVCMPIRGGGGPIILLPIDNKVHKCQVKPLKLPLQKTCSINNKNIKQHSN